MARLLRSQPLQPKYLGPYLPPVPPPVVTTLSVNFASGLLTNQRRRQQRFPLQGWSGGGAADSSVSRVVTDLFYETSGSTFAIGALATGAQRAQAFTNVAGVLKYVEVSLLKVGAPADNVVLEIQTNDPDFNVPSGVVLDTVAISAATVTASLATYRFTLPAGVTLSSQTKYWVVLRRSGGIDSSNFVRWGDSNNDYIFSAVSFNTGTSLWSVDGVTLQVRLGTDMPGTRSVYSYKRNLGPFPPLLQLPPPFPTISVTTATGVLTNQRRAQQRRTAYRLGYPVVVAYPAAIETTIATPLVRSRPGPTHLRYAGPVVVAASGFSAPPVSVNCVSPDRLAHRFRRQAPGTALAPPIVLQTFAGARAPLIRTRPRRRSAYVTPPTLLRGPVVEQQIAVALVRSRPRHTTGAVSQTPYVFAVAAATFAAMKTPLVEARPRHTVSALHPPTVIRVPAVEQREQTLSITSVRTRPRRTVARFSGPATLEPYAVELREETIRVALVRIRPRHTISALYAPAVLQTFVGPRVELARIRPRKTGSFLSEPTAVRVPSVEQREQTLSVALTRTRPRPTIHLLFAPTALAVFAGPKTLTVRTRPRPAREFLEPPTVVRVPQVEQHEQTISVSLARIRPRPQVARLFAPTTLRVFFGPLVSETRTRPRKTTSFLAKPTVVRTPSVEQREQTITVALARIRPRPTTTAFVVPATLEPFAVELREETIRTALARARPRATAHILGKPTVLQTFVGPAVVKTRIRPRRTIAELQPPSTLTPYAVELAEATIRVALAHIRPRHTISALRPPAVVRVPAVEQAEQTVKVTLARIRPRVFRALLAPPTALQVFDGPAVTAIKIRPRPTRLFLAAPTVIRIPAVEQAEQTIRVALVKTRPRHTLSALPLVLAPTFPPLVTAITVRTVRARPRPTTRALAAPTVLSVFAAAKAPFVRARPRPARAFVKPPTVLRVPSVEQQEDTIRVALTRTRPRPTVRDLQPPTVLQTFRGPQVSLAHARPRPTRHYIAAPTVVRVPAVERVEQTIRIALAKIRPRPTAKRLIPPAALQTFAGPEVALAHIRPRPTRRFLTPPTVVRTPSVEQQEQTIRATLVSLRAAQRRRTTHVLTAVSYPATREISVTLARIRPRPTAHRLTAISYPQTSEITTALVRARPRPTTHRVFAPVVLQTFAAGVPTLAHTRPRPTRRFLNPPTAIRVPSVEQAKQTIRTTLVRTRPRPTRRFLVPPLVKTFPPVVTTLAVTSVAVRTRVEQRRHVVEHVLRQPISVIPLPTLRMQTVQVALVETRPRRTHAVLTAVRVAATSQIKVAAVRTRPRATTASLSPPAAVTQPEPLTARVALARIRPSAVASALRPPTALIRETFSGPAVTLAPSRRAAGRAALRPPTAVTIPPPTPAQQTLNVTLVDVPVRQRLRVGRWILPPVLPPYPPSTIPGFPASSGYAVAGASSEGGATTGADSDGGAISGTASEGGAVAAVESDGWAAPGTASTEG